MITNDPILLNETGLQMVQEMKAQNSLLSIIASSSREAIYSDLDQIAAIVRNGYGPKAFPIGDRLIDPWTDVDTSTPYDFEWAIADHRTVELETGEQVPGMILQAVYGLPYANQFSNFQAFIKLPAGLVAGNYNIILAATWGQATAGAVNFTLTQPVPAGGLLSGLEAMPDTAPANWRVKSWALPTDANPIETVVVTRGDPIGTTLGTLQLTTRQDELGLNSMQRTGYGSNRWKTSANRARLNSNGLNWFVPSADDPYAIRPTDYNQNGFMAGVSQGLLNATKKVKVTTLLNTVEGFGVSETTFDRFFLPSLEAVNATPQSIGPEGPVFPYWKRKLGIPGFAAGHPTTYPAYRIGTINAKTTPQTVRLRSANRGNAYYTWNLYSSGNVISSYASGARRSSPVCVVA